MVAVAADLEGRKHEALRRLHALDTHPDEAVQRAARDVAVAVEAMPARLDEALQAQVPEGAVITGAQFQLRAIPLVQTRRGITGLYVFRRPFRVRVTRDGEYFLCTSSTFLVHGTGDSLSDAMQDFFKEWHQHYQFLVKLEQRQRLGEALRRELDQIRRRLRHPTPVPLPDNVTAAV